MQSPRKLEESLESLLFHHPYLLDDRLDPECRMQRQYVAGNVRVDILLKHRSRIICVECKRTGLMDRDVTQLAGYLEILEAEFPLARTHYLVGKPGPLKSRAVRTKRGVIRIREVGKDIPLHLFFDSATGRYRKARAIEIDRAYLLNL